MKGGGFGLLLNIVIGGNWLFATLGVSLLNGVIGDILTGAIGDSVILFVADLFKKIIYFHFL